MPPRIQISKFSCALSTPPSSSVSASTSMSPLISLATAGAVPPMAKTIISATTIAQHRPSFCHYFSSSAPVAARRHREAFKAWLKSKGERFKTPDGEPNYLGGQNQPFPLNPLFRSTPVLSEDARELIWSKVMKEGHPLKAVSAELGVDIRRVAAVVRLKEVEKDWIAKGKPLAKPYAKAVLAMLPQTTYTPDRPPRKHEHINEVPVHPYTLQQLFLPVSESRHFARADAADAFHRGLLPADARIPHPELVQMEREIRVEGVAPVEAAQKFRDLTAESERLIAARQAKKEAWEKKQIVAVQGPRVEFRFKNMNVDDVGPKGRSPNGVGWRYGVASYDRKKGQIKIPTSVE